LGFDPMNKLHLLKLKNINKIKTYFLITIFWKPTKEKDKIC